MKTLSYHDDHDEPLTALRACVIYHTWRWRNSWHGAESLNFRSSDHFAAKATEQALASTLRGAKRHAEAWRAPGSVFHIRELPSLFADAGSIQMVFAQVDVVNPFADWEPSVALLGRPLRLLGLSLWQHTDGELDEAHLLRATLDPDEVPEPLIAGRVFRDWSSSPAGAKRNQLGWSGRPAQTDGRGVLSVQEAFAHAGSQELE
ncbi:hypothetical protein M2152_002607 [Microbacteriaceae bacterium SG_E_30_P1]|uniref:PAS domain-containing protein n=1 Tax=Antiquaquibacter oligotrophicus TaxID=2880260 RepID=A0ABT6KRK8_9MICO|nr:hypothetical protein [Antiquaquibacter oligotrophicus]MDH6182425.1 hypothetical protein [Antiquaquibacter oligotrophicus]UDF14604.1 hypothetical protein LH407_07010 [Antiquaquibacter oligotrophicus]